MTTVAVYKGQPVALKNVSKPNMLTKDDMCNLKLVSVVYWCFEASTTAITTKRSYKSTLLQLAGRIFSTTTYIKRQCILQRDIKCVQSLSRLKLNKIELSGYFSLYTESVWFT